MAPTTDNDYGQFVYLDIEDYIEEYDGNNRPIYCKVGSKNYRHSRYADNLEYEADYDNKYWLENIKTNAACYCSRRRKRIERIS
jgi:hypothetical protein